VRGGVRAQRQAATRKMTARDLARRPSVGCARERRRTRLVRVVQRLALRRGAPRQRLRHLARGRATHGGAGRRGRRRRGRQSSAGKAWEPSLPAFTTRQRAARRVRRGSPAQPAAQRCTTGAHRRPVRPVRGEGGVKCEKFFLAPACAGVRQPRALRRRRGQPGAAQRSASASESARARRESARQACAMPPGSDTRNTQLGELRAHLARRRAVAALRKLFGRPRRARPPRRLRAGHCLARPARPRARASRTLPTLH
jgi:hypothetical protein